MQAQPRHRRGQAGDFVDDVPRAILDGVVHVVVGGGTEDGRDEHRAGHAAHDVFVQALAQPEDAFGRIQIAGQIEGGEVALERERARQDDRDDVLPDVPLARRKGPAPPAPGRSP